MVPSERTASFFWVVTVHEVSFRLKSWTFEDGLKLFHVSHPRDYIKEPEIIPHVGPILIVIPF